MKRRSRHSNADTLARVRREVAGYCHFQLDEIGIEAMHNDLLLDLLKTMRADAERARRARLVLALPK